jgi:hypothetical protein
MSRLTSFGCFKELLRGGFHEFLLQGVCEKSVLSEKRLPERLRGLKLEHLICEKKGAQNGWGAYFANPPHQNDPLHSHQSLFTHI